MKNLHTALIFVCLCACLWACRPTTGGHDHGTDHDDHGHGHGEGQGHDDHGHGDGTTVITHFTDQTELFVEFGPLVAGQTTEAAAHITRLSDFRALTAGRLEVGMVGVDGTQTFAVDKPARPGVFRPQLKPKTPGRYQLVFRLEAHGLDSVHTVGEVRVHASADAARHAAAHASEEEPADTISFHKEQQWRTDFGLSVVAKARIRPAFDAFGTIRPRADGEAWISAPMAGRLVAGKGFPQVGMHVTRGQALALLSPRLAEQGDEATLEAAVQQASTAVRQAERERRRLERLAAAGAIAGKRVVTARFAEERARTAQETARRRLRQTRRVERTDDGPAEGVITIRSPIAGTVVAVDRPPGAWVDQGQRLFRVIDVSRLWLEVHVVETHLGELKETHGAWFEVEGLERTFEVPADALVTIGNVVDSRTRTVPMLFAIDNPDRKLRVGHFADVHVIGDKPRQSLAVPVSAIVMESGMPVVYVQTGGESFVRRALRTGVRDGDLIEVLEGLRVGERVVSRGAYTVRLAGSSGELSAGHHH